MKSNLNNSAVIKGVKIINNQTAQGYLTNKFESTIALDVPKGPASYNNILALEIAQTQASTSSKNGPSNSSMVQYDKTCEISSILNEFEKNKNFNKELLLMRNIGSPKQPSTHGSQNK